MLQLQILSVVEETLTIHSFRLERPKEFSFQAGQWMDVYLPSGLSHTFSISSSPTEPFLQFTTMFHEPSAFKNELWNLPIGTQLKIDGPHGHFVLNSASTVPLFFLAGGIGMTPFRSILTYVRDSHLQKDIFAVQSAKDSGLVLFDELDVTRVLTSVDGRLNAQKIKTICPDFLSREWWICGPAGFVDAMMDAAKQLGLNPERVKSEDFPGY